MPDSQQTSLPASHPASQERSLGEQSQESKYQQMANINKYEQLSINMNKSQNC
jgi:hypothetical protein